MLYTKFRDQREDPQLHLFGQLKKITREWLEGGYLQCFGGPAQLVYKELADMACNKIVAAITKAELHRSEFLDDFRLKKSYGWTV